MSKNKRYKIHHMQIPWEDMANTDNSVVAIDAPLAEKAILVGRIGLMQLSAGAGAYRVRDSMNTIAETLGITCSADVGLTSINYTCFDEGKSYAESLTLKTTGINTHKLMSVSLFVKEFPKKAGKYSISAINETLDKIKFREGNYQPWMVSLAAAFACGAFTFLLGGGWIEMLCAFIGAGLGNFVRVKMLHRKITLFANLVAGVAVACCAYIVSETVAEMLFHLSSAHQCGYICSMLFVIPGFPLITGGIDIAKLDMRSGIERISYAVLIITVATLTGWVIAMLFHFGPSDFVALNLNPIIHCVLRLLASFIGVFGFSIMFNSTPKMAAAAGLIGMLANTLRLELIDFINIPISVAAFIGSLFAGILASFFKKKLNYPRVSLTVPSIVIMVPGMYMYKAIYFIGQSSIEQGAMWLTNATLIVFALPLGLVFARLLTDKDFRYCT